VKIRQKTLLVLLLVTISLMSIVYEVSQKIMLDSISVSENEEAASNAQRFITNLNMKLQNLNQTGWDWSQWDATYQFVENNNSAYINGNMLDNTFINLGLNLMLFINESRQLVFGKEFDLDNQTEINLKNADVNRVLRNNYLFTNDPTQSKGGLILFGGAPMLVISQPILTSAAEGPIHGTLILGTFLDKSETNTLAQSVGLPIQTFIIGTSPMPKDFQQANMNLSPQEPIFVQVTNRTNVASYVLLQDVSSSPILIAEVDSYRTAYLQAKTSLNYLLAAFVALGIAIFAVTSFLLDKVVILRVRVLTDDVIKIEPNSDNTDHVTVRGNDELSNLGDKINDMLTTIHNSRIELKKHAENLEAKVEERTSELKKSQELLRSIFTASPDSILAVDLKYNIVDANKQLHESSGYSREDLIGKPASLFLYEADYRRILKKLENQNSSTIHLECNIIKKDMSAYPSELAIGAMRNAQGFPFGFVVMIKDLTEKKELEKKLFNSERLAAIGELAGMIGHDLRNPLQGIKSAVYFLKKKGDTLKVDQAKAMLETIEKGVNHSDKIINDLLDYARNMHLELQENLVQNVLTGALAMVRIPDNVKVINAVSEEVAFRVDKNKVERVFINLVKNAIDAMPNGGTITINGEQTNGNIEVTFADTGSGIPEDILPKIFSPLFTTKAQGMGFGLAICKRIIEAHGGTITVETETDKGTAFKISLPTEAQRIIEDEKVSINLPEPLLPTKKG
jgi:PAS domain S-box-containing protein